MTSDDVTKRNSLQIFEPQSLPQRQRRMSVRSFYWVMVNSMMSQEKKQDEPRKKYSLELSSLTDLFKPLPLERKPSVRSFYWNIVDEAVNRSCRELVSFFVFGRLFMFADRIDMA
ncbi:hypothetical protein GWI33_017633 [Rhynchophorus ferrugineus]|uniref:Uncharacterized protein n=1 Tax=Rhynchophorus ferrugineus TaxID=354439 RepID=A0A834M7G0_RHYFE|nr:hypothetical protein GWI33_017633 [Rhynchophorus ferrugineus]